MSTLNQLSRSYSFQIVYLELYISNNKLELEKIYPRGRVFFRLMKLEQEKQSVDRCNVKQCDKQRHIFVNFCSKHSPKNRD